MAPLRAELERCAVATRPVDDALDAYSRYRRLQIRRGSSSSKDAAGFDLTLFAHAGQLNLVRDEEDATRVWLHTEVGPLPARLMAHDASVLVMHTAHVRAVVRAHFRQEAFERELARLLPSECVLAIEPTEPGSAHVAVYYDASLTSDPVLECEVGASAQGLAVTHLALRYLDEAHLARASRLLADDAHGWTLDADGVLEIACLPLPTWRATLRAASLLAQAVAAADAADAISDAPAS